MPPWVVVDEGPHEVYLCKNLSTVSPFQSTSNGIAALSTLSKPSEARDDHDLGFRVATTQRGHRHEQWGAQVCERQQEKVSAAATTAADPKNLQFQSSEVLLVARLTIKALTAATNRRTHLTFPGMLHLMGELSPTCAAAGIAWTSGVFSLLPSKDKARNAGFRVYGLCWCVDFRARRVLHKKLRVCYRFPFGRGIRNTVAHRPTC